MKAFMDSDFMLSLPPQHLYRIGAAGMPICDYHCHIPPREIYENRRFDNGGSRCGWAVTGQQLRPAIIISSA